MGKQVRNGVNYGLYDFYLTGVPADQEYTMFQWPLEEAGPEVVAPAYLSDTGRLCMHAGACQGTSGPYVMMALLSAPGLPHRIGITSKDKKYGAAVMVVPDPIIGEDKGCSVEVLRVRMDFTVAVLRGKGFPPNDEVQYVSNSEGEQIKGSFKAKDQGQFTIGLAPGVKGKLQGTDQVKFKGSVCAPAVTYHWGTLEIQ
jgi:hypothetical protein